ncbi:MAG TPA: hypothetical protein PK745_18795, partial [bacterium]|nr:hypothetical protein [bacterium]
MIVVAFSRAIHHQRFVNAGREKVIRQHDSVPVKFSGSVVFMINEFQYIISSTARFFINPLPYPPAVAVV